jgi:hypothetical protein
MIQTVVLSETPTKLLKMGLGYTCNNNGKIRGLEINRRDGIIELQWIEYKNIVTIDIIDREAVPSEDSRFTIKKVKGTYQAFQNELEQREVN